MGGNRKNIFGARSAIFEINHLRVSHAFPVVILDRFKEPFFKDNENFPKIGPALDFNLPKEGYTAKNTANANEKGKTYAKAMENNALLKHE